MANDQKNYTSSKFKSDRLNTIATARLPEKNTAQFNLEYSDDRLTTFIGLQVHERFQFGIRQREAPSLINPAIDRTYSGLDLKFKLLEESHFIPETVLGLEGAFGHSRFSGEYLSFSKRYFDLDFTGGIGWGRFAGQTTLKNPLRVVSSHFNDDRDLNDEAGQTLDQLFVGQDIGLFGGVSYTPSQLPWLRLMADWNSIDFTFEDSLGTDFDVPEPWSLGASLSPIDGVELTAAYVGGEEFLTRLTLSSDLSKLPFIKERPRKTLKHTNASNIIQPSKYLPATQIIKNHIQNAQKKEGKNTFFLSYKGLSGPSITLPQHGISRLRNGDIISQKELLHNSYFGSHNKYKKNKILNSINFQGTLKNEFSLQGETVGTAYRQSFIGELEATLLHGLGLNLGLRSNLGHNLDTVEVADTSDDTPIRSDVFLFADQGLFVDSAYLTYRKSLTPSVHLAASGGYLEEAFAGYGAELLHRPFDSRLAVGAEIWHAFRRDPLSTLGLNLAQNSAGQYQDHVTALANIYYDIPQSNLTLQLHGGRYLDGDYGGGIDFKKKLKRGIEAHGFMRASNENDKDIFGENANLFAGLGVSFPLYYNIPKVKNSVCCDVIVQTQPFGRDKAQRLNKPVDLYDDTDFISKKALISY